eukprot:tig00001636_g9537.t1
MRRGACARLLPRRVASEGAPGPRRPSRHPKARPEDFDIAHRRTRAGLLARALPGPYEEMAARRNAKAAEAGGSVSGGAEVARALERLLRDAEARIVEGVAQLAARSASTGPRP